MEGTGMKRKFAEGTDVPVADHVRPRIATANAEGKMVPLLPAPGN
jgi:hypothetical protein